jgi:hypothetical protein
MAAGMVASELVYGGSGPGKSAQELTALGLLLKLKAAGLITLETSLMDGGPVLVSGDGAPGRVMVSHEAAELWRALACD